MNQEQRCPASYNLEENNGMWRGDSVGIKALHEWVGTRFKKTKLCQHCKKTPPRDLANKGIYNRCFKNWEWLCRKCHMLTDGRLEKLKIRNQLLSNKLHKKCSFCGSAFVTIPSKNARYCSKSCSNKGRYLIY